MRRLTIVTTLAATALVTGLLTLSADAQTWRRGAVAVDAASKNFTPIEKAACGGGGPHCPPGRTWVCRGGTCWCAPC
jgi:hypothetical protein